MAQKHDLQYLDFVEYVLNNGFVKTDRTNTGTISVNSYQMRFDLSDWSAPVLTTKKMFTRGMREEILWYFRGETNINSLLAANVHIWDQWVPLNNYINPRFYKDDVVLVKLRLELYEGNVVPRDDNTNESRYNPTCCGVGYLGREKYDFEDQHNRTRLHNLWSKMMERCYNVTHDKYQLYGGAGVTVCDRWHNFATFVQDVARLPNYRLWLLNHEDEYQLDKDFFGGSQYSPNHCLFIRRRDNIHLIHSDGTKCIATHTDGRTVEFVNAAEFCEEQKLSESSVSYARTISVSGVHKGWTFKNVEPEAGHVFRANVFKTDKGLLDLGKVYGHMWRSWPDTQIVNTPLAQWYEDRGYELLGHLDGYEDYLVMHKNIDQLADVIHELKTTPDSRRMIVNGWNPALIPVDLKNPGNNVSLGLQALPPCHCMFQFTVLNGKLNCDLRQRSADIGLGVPFNIAQYSLITLLIAKMVGLEPGEFVWNGVDCHIYSNHVEALKLQLSRRDNIPDSPTVRISDRVRDISPEEVEMDDMEIVGYTTPYEKLEMGVAT